MTSDAGALVVRELIGQLGIDEYLAERLADPRDQDLITHPLVELLRTALLLVSHGWGALTDADVLRDDPVLRLSVSERRGDAPLRPQAGGGWVHGDTHVCDNAGNTAQAQQSVTVS